MPVIVPDEGGPIVITTGGGGGGGGGGSGTPSDTPVGLTELVRRIRMLLEDYPLQDITTADITTTTQQHVTVADASMWKAGNRAEFDDGTGEQVIIGDVTSPTLSALRRAAYGTTAALHPTETYLLREPRFGYQQITDALEAIIIAMFRGILWVPTSASATPSVSDPIYELPADFVGLIRVTQATSGGSYTDSVSYGTRGSGFRVDILKDVDSAVSSTGLALRIPATNNLVNDLRVLYGANPAPSNLPDGPMAEAAVLGAASRIMAAKDIPRTGDDVSQGDASVSPGAMAREAAYLWAQFLDARRRAKEDLLRRGALIY